MFSKESFTSLFASLYDVLFCIDSILFNISSANIALTMSCLQLCENATELSRTKVIFYVCTKPLHPFNICTSPPIFRASLMHFHHPQYASTLLIDFKAKKASKQFFIDCDTLRIFTLIRDDIMRRSSTIQMLWRATEFISFAAMDFCADRK